MLRLSPRTRRIKDAVGFTHPGRVVVVSFACAIAVGTIALSMPFATESGSRPPFLNALFTATSAVCVTGLVTVDTSSYWSAFGEIVILVLIQAGGLGIMTLATLVVVLISRRLGLRGRLIAQAQSRTLSGSDVRRIIRNVVLFSLICEAAATVVLTARFVYGYHRGWAESLYDGLFHSVSAFNNAGFSLNADSLMTYVGDPWVLLTIGISVIVGGIGFPVVFELLRAWRTPKLWSVLTRLTVIVTVTLLLAGTLVFFIVERDNPATLGPVSGVHKLIAAFFTSIMPRTAGFNAVDIGAMQPESWLFTDILMFIGGGSAGTAGGIKVSTFGLLAFVVWAEIRGEPNVNIGFRRVTAANQREALTIALLWVGLVGTGTFLLLGTTDLGVDKVSFEVISALGTVGLSTGITSQLPPAAEVVLVVLMFVGRLGPLTFATALALRRRTNRYELPEERMIVG